MCTVLLGGDTPLGPALITGLIDAGFIVITSVSSSSAVEGIESAGHGFVKALVLDPVAASAWLSAQSQNKAARSESEPSNSAPDPTALFIRSLHGSLSLRFPLNRSGDPYASSTTQFPYIHSVLSLLTLSPPSLPEPTAVFAPFERLDLSSAYLTHLTQMHVLPLHLIQSLLPLLRASYPRHLSKSRIGKLGAGRSVIVCVPATDARVGLPFLMPNSVAALANVRAVEVLRREVKAARDVGSNPSFSQGVTSEPKSREREVDNMSDLRIVLVDVGTVGSALQHDEDFGESGVSLDEKNTVMLDSSLDSATVGWTQSERAIYGNAYPSLTFPPPVPTCLGRYLVTTKTGTDTRINKNRTIIDQIFNANPHT